MQCLQDIMFINNTCHNVHSGNDLVSTSTLYMYLHYGKVTYLVLIWSPYHLWLYQVPCT